MGIKQSIVTESGITINDSYARIDTTSGNKSSQSFTLNYYISQEAFEERKSFVKQELYTCPVSVEDNSSNFIKQEYEYLKLLPAFENSIDA